MNIIPTCELLAFVINGMTCYVNSRKLPQPRKELESVLWMNDDSGTHLRGSLGQIMTGNVPEKKALCKH